MQDDVGEFSWRAGGFPVGDGEPFTGSAPSVEKPEGLAAAGLDSHGIGLVGIAFGTLMRLRSRNPIPLVL